MDLHIGGCNLDGKDGVAITEQPARQFQSVIFEHMVEGSVTKKCPYLLALWSIELGGLVGCEIIKTRISSIPR